VITQTGFTAEPAASSDAFSCSTFRSRNREQRVTVAGSALALVPVAIAVGISSAG
jgi:hypothetical protein